MVNRTSEPGISPVCSIQGLAAGYDKNLVLKDFSCVINPGEIIGLLGPNGAGKTTLMRVLSGSIKAHMGSLIFNGDTMALGAKSFRKHVGFVFQEPSLDGQLTVRENLHLGGSLFGLSGTAQKKRANELMNFLDIEGRAPERVKTLSGGLKRRVELARALMHTPSLLILDEPSTGLDPFAFHRFWQLLQHLKRQNVSMLLSTHRSDEAELCDRILVLYEGRVVADASPEDLLREVKDDLLILEPVDVVSMQVALTQRFSLQTTVDKQFLLLRTAQGHSMIPKLAEAFPGVWKSISLRRPSLADAFFKITGRTLEDLNQLQEAA